MDEPLTIPRNVSLVHDMADFAAFLQIMASSFQAEEDRVRAMIKAGGQYIEGDLTSIYVSEFSCSGLHGFMTCLQPGARLAELMKTLNWQTLAFQIDVASYYE
jgi:hypothetical protein